MYAALTYEALYALMCTLWRCAIAALAITDAVWDCFAPRGKLGGLIQEDWNEHW